MNDIFIVANRNIYHEGWEYLYVNGELYDECRTITLSKIFDLMPISSIDGMILNDNINVGCNPYDLEIPMPKKLKDIPYEWVDISERYINYDLIIKSREHKRKIREDKTKQK